jgi:hypothetical protein
MEMHQKTLNQMGQKTNWNNIKYFQTSSIFRYLDNGWKHVVDADEDNDGDGGQSSRSGYDGQGVEDEPETRTNNFYLNFYSFRWCVLSHS